MTQHQPPKSKSPVCDGAEYNPYLLSPPVDQYARSIKMVNGMPEVVLEAPLISVDKSGLQNMMNQALLLPYDGNDPRYVGLSKGAAMIIDLVDQASKGSDSARKEVLDRLLGKAVQNIKTLSIRATMEQVLAELEPVPGEEDIVLTRTPTPEEQADLL